jgi:aspartate-semialdehyde dehydrogenase
VIPQVEAFQKDGATKEEWAIAAELRKVVDPDLQVHANCAIVPSFIGSGYFVTLETESPLEEQEVRALLKDAPGVSVVDHRMEEGYVTPAEVPGEDPIFVSRIRRDTTVENGLSFWIAADALRKGTALNAVQIAELLRDAYL